MLSLNSTITELKGVGPKISRWLTRLEIHTIEDLLRHFPSRYEDFSNITTINQLKLGERGTIRGKIQLINTRRSWKRRLTITEALIKDTSGSVKAVWFNQPYLGETLKPGLEVMLAGTLTAGHYGVQFEHPAIEPVGHSLHTGRLVPIYPSTAQLGQRVFRNLIAKALPLASALSDPLPKLVLSQAKLPPLPKAVYNLHQPKNLDELKQARRRVTFDELFTIHLRSMLARQKMSSLRSQPIPFSPATKKLVTSLPWPLTNDQRLASWEIIKDLGQTKPMYRLLHGDVGSGKTVVAGLAAFNCAQAGLQTAWLAPTEILAEQHFHTLAHLFKDWPITCALLTRGHHRHSHEPAATAASLKRQLKEGKISVLVGTHALLQSDIAFRELGLVVVDEQHRFGVGHRHALLSESKLVPHLLSMTATPIPRSLALTIYGDLAMSILKNLPPGRQTIITRIVKPDERQHAYNIMKDEVRKGNRVFIVCPMIEESENLAVRAATAEYDRLQREIFKNVKLGLLHGQLTTKEKAKVMGEFKDGLTPILVSTSVVEVGVDVPEATVMAIEGAERFGLAQLHQFRGRVGRSERPSICLLMTDSAHPAALARLEALVKHQSGFDLAEIDLKMRGPGDLLGEAQSGFLKLRFAELADSELLKTVRETAAKLIASDPNLESAPQLKANLSQKSFHPE